MSNADATTALPYVDALLAVWPDHGGYGDTTQAAEGTPGTAQHLVQVREGHGLATREEPSGTGSVRCRDQAAPEGDLAVSAGHLLASEVPTHQLADDLRPLPLADDRAELIPQFRRVGSDDAGGFGVPVKAAVFRHAPSVDGGLPPCLDPAMVVDIHHPTEVTMAKNATLTPAMQHVMQLVERHGYVDLIRDGRKHRRTVDALIERGMLREFGWFQRGAGYRYYPTTDRDAVHAEALTEHRTRQGFEMTARMADILRSAVPMTGFITVYVGDEEDAMIRAGLIRRDADSDYFIEEAGVQMLKNWEALYGAPGDIPNPTQTIRDADHAEAIAEDVRHMVVSVARNAGSSTTLAAIGRLRDRAHAEALAEQPIAATEKAICKHDGRPIARRTDRVGAKWHHDDERGGRGCGNGHHREATPDVIDGEALDGSQPEVRTCMRMDGEHATHGYARYGEGCYVLEVATAPAEAPTGTAAALSDVDKLRGRLIALGAAQFTHDMLNRIEAALRRELQ